LAGSEDFAENHSSGLDRERSFLMRAVLICPGERSGVAFLAQSGPLVTLSVLGEPFLHYWFEFLYAAGIKEVLLIATDRPDQVRAVAGNGSRWGLKVEIKAELQEPAVEEVQAQYGGKEGQSRVILLDHLPGMPLMNVFASYSHCFAAVKEWLVLSPKQHRIGLREIQPGIWFNRGARVASSAHLESPCWIGENVRVGPHARIGPEAILESRIMVEQRAEIAHSIVGPETFVGSLTHIADSVAWGNNLINWKNGSCIQVPDSFLLCPLSQFTFWDRTRPLFRFWNHLTQFFRSSASGEK
jgi:NDP-sugar pyrophosphorylase family protein